MSQCAILSARNADVDEINEQVTNSLDPNTEHIYTAIDCTANYLAEPLVFCDHRSLNRVVPAQISNAKLERNDRCEREVNRLRTGTDPPVRC